MTFNRRLSFIIVRGIRSQGTGIRAPVMTHCSVDRQSPLAAIAANRHAAHQRGDQSRSRVATVVYPVGRRRRSSTYFAEPPRGAWV
jgi:hypothetical protein